MAVKSRAKEVALEGIRTATAKVAIYGLFAPGPPTTPFAREMARLNYSFNAPAEVSGVWTMVSSDSVTFEIDSAFLDGGVYTVQGVRIYEDVGGDLLLEKPLAESVTYTDPGEFIVESYTLTIPN
jgi:hypothetical protein